MTKAVTKDPSDQFAQSTKKWVRVIAGPGTGKSFNLKKRVLHHVNEEMIAPEKILVVTFTSITAQDLRKDIHNLDKEYPGLNLDKVVVSTLHSLALEQLNQIKGFGRKMEGFEVETMLRDLEPDIGKMSDKKALLRKCACKGISKSLTNRERVFKKALNDWLKLHQGYTLEHPIPEMCQHLKDRKIKQRFCFDRIMVDEYQDLNPDEQEYIKLLTSANGRLAVIGDDDQSIYGFKGASPEGIRKFVKRHSFEDVRFSVCRRCPKEVVLRATRLIHNNDHTGRIPKVFTALDTLPDGKVELIPYETPDEEIKELCDVIRKELDDPQLETIVVLSPTKGRGQKMYEQMKAEMIPTDFCYRGFLLDSKAVCENVAYLTLASNHDDLVAWRYLLGGSKGERCATSYHRILDAAKREKKEVLDVLEECVSNNQIAYTSVIVKRYQNIKAKLNDIMLDPSKLLVDLDPSESQYSSILNEAIKDRFATDGFAGVRRAVLEAIYSVYSPGTPAAGDKRVRIMSLHSAKGLSAHLVIVMSAVDGLIPLGSHSDIEEQRRLFYVAITRCKGEKITEGGYAGKLIISTFKHAQNGEEYSISPFIEEMGLRLPS